MNIVSPVTGGVMGIPVINNFANPIQFVCSSIQAGSRLGYQESAEMCAQYLAPILDAIKFNFPPFGVNQFASAMTLPKHIAYSEPRLQPPPGYKDTTVPGIWSRDTLFSHGNHEQGWVTAPGMQGIDVQPFTANMLMPESLAELMGGPDAPIPAAPPTFGGPHQAGPPNAYTENTPLPPPWYPQPGPPPAPAPGVIPGDPGSAALTGPLPAPGPAAQDPPRRRHRRRSDRHYPPRQVDDDRDAQMESDRATHRRAGGGRAGAEFVRIAWKGIANVPLPGGPGTGSDRMTVYVQMPDTLALNVNSRVRVADVYVGRVRAIELKNWVATLTLDLQPDVKLPSNALARIGQTSLLGSQHVELEPPPDPSGNELRTGDTIPLQNSSAFPSTERVLASIATILRGGGVQNLETIQTEIFNVLNGRADQIREFLNKLDTFTDELNQQTEDITRAIDSTNRLLSIVAQRNDTLDRVLTEFPPLIKHFAETRDLFADAVEALGRVSVRRRQRVGTGERQPEHQPAEPAAAAQAAGQGVAVPDRRAEADAHRAVLDRERAEGGPRRLPQRVADGRPDAVGARQHASCRARVSRACCAHSSSPGAAIRRR